MSLSDLREKPTRQTDCHMPQLSAELTQLGFSVVALSVVSERVMRLRILSLMTRSHLYTQFLMMGDMCYEYLDHHG